MCIHRFRPCSCSTFSQLHVCIYRNMYAYTESNNAQTGILLHLPMHICINIYIYVYIYTHIHSHLCMYTWHTEHGTLLKQDFEGTCASTKGCVYLCVCACVYFCFVCVCGCVWVCERRRECVCAC